MRNETGHMPDTPVEHPNGDEVPPEILKRIKGAWVLGCISIGITVALTLVALGGADVLGLDATAFVDAAIMAGLTFGTYKKSRTCAVGLLLFFALNKILMWVEAGTPSGAPLALVFLYYFGQGVVGTFQYHRHVSSAGAAQPGIPAPIG